MAAPELHIRLSAIIEQKQREDEELRALKIINGAAPEYRQQCLWGIINWIYLASVANREVVKDEQLSDPLHHNPLIE